jgi:aspartate aminotransferase
LIIVNRNAGYWVKEKRMSISQMGRSIGQSVTLRLNEKAAILREKGDPVIHLAGGEPKIKAPVDAVIAASNLLTSAEVRYTPADGLPATKKGIIHYTEEHYNRLVAPENVIVSNGAKQAIMVALQAILNPQEEVIFPAPYWVSYPEMTKICNAVPIPVLAEDGTFQPRVEDLAAKIGPYTKAIIINSPNNPTGAVYHRDFIGAVVELARQKDLYLIMDDIYHQLIFDNREPVNVFDFVPDFNENAKLIVVNGVSKQYAMTGFRIGWAIANRKLIEVMKNIQAHQTGGPSSVLQKASIGAMMGIQSIVNNLRMTLENNRNVMIRHLRAFEGLHFEVPGGTFYVFVDFSNYERDSRKLAEYLLEKVQVTTIPGVEFGMEGYLRLSYCGSIKDITAGLERIKWALDPNSPNELFIGDRKLIREWA